MLKTTFSISAILGLLALSACAPQNTVRRTGNSGEEALKTRAITLYTEGQLAAMSGDFANALRYYYRAYLLDTTNAVILNSIGRTHLQADNYKSAELYLRKAVVLDNRDVENWTALGEALSRHAAISASRRCICPGCGAQATQYGYSPLTDVCLQPDG
jgi:Flp pilus assembly protein TadD